MKSTLILKSAVFQDIRFWILIFILIRLIGITNPPLEVTHNWRQTTVTMVARNFYETHSSIFYPRIDFAGNKTGITGMEFPLLNYLISLISWLFGYAHWYGRLINLLISSVGIFYFFKIVSRHFDKNIAFNATIILLSSIWFTYSRKIMPDTFSMSLVIIAFYFGTNYLEQSKNRILNLVLYSTLMTLGILSKLPSGFILVLFSLFYFDVSIHKKEKIVFSIVTFLLLIPVGFWYFYWVPFLVEKYQFWHFFMGKSIFQGMTEITNHLHDSFANFYDSALKFIGLFMFVIGLIGAYYKRDKLLIYVFILSSLTFSAVVFKSGETFSRHAYYVIPFVPIMAIIAGYGIQQLNSKKLIFIVLLAISIEGILNRQHDFFLSKEQRFFSNLEVELNSFSKKDDLFLVNSSENPTPLYFSHRKGWLSLNQNIENERYVNSLKKKGCKYILIIKKYFATDSHLNYSKIRDNSFYSVYKL